MLELGIPYIIKQTFCNKSSDTNTARLSNCPTLFFSLGQISVVQRYKKDWLMDKRIVVLSKNNSPSYNNTSKPMLNLKTEH